jgi:hypothetical protein
MTRTFRLDLPLCREASNCSSLHPSRCFSSTSGRHLVFDQLWDFFPKYRYGKIVATVRGIWIPVRTYSSIRQVAHSKFRCPDASLRGPNARATYMEMRKALIWKLLAVKVRPSDNRATASGHGSNQERISAKFWKADRTIVRLDALCLWSGRRPGFSGQTLI